MVLSYENIFSEGTAMNRFILAVVAALVMQSAAQAEFCDHIAQQVNGISRHYGTSREMNEWNPGMGLVCSPNANTSLFVGVYQNSFDADSTYAGFAKYAKFGGDWHVDPGVVVMGVTGYPQWQFQSTQYRGVTGVAYFLLAVGYRNDFKLNVGYGPTRWFNSHGVDVVTLNMEIGLQ